MRYSILRVVPTGATDILTERLRGILHSLREITGAIRSCSHLCKSFVIDKLSVIQPSDIT
jgi:hypothetical protein